jgi:hypothetical protein
VILPLLLAALLALAQARVAALPRVTPSVSALPRLPVLARTVPLTSPLAAQLTPTLSPSLTPLLTPGAPPALPPSAVPSAPDFVAPAPAGPLAVDFDGSGERSDEPVSPSELSSWLDIGDGASAASLDAAAEPANQTKVGRRILWEAAKLLRDARLPVDVLDLGRNHGEYDYLEKRLRLHRKLLKPENRAQLAATLIHELRHVLQHAEGVPAEALEMEIEAHLDDLAFMRELGVEPPPKTFARQSAEALKKGAEEFVTLLEAALGERPRLASMTWERIEADLLEQLKQAKRGRSERKKKLVAAIERDLELVRSREGRAAYRAFSQRVEARLRREAGK